MPVGLWTSPWRSRCTVVVTGRVPLLLGCGSGYGGGRTGSRRQGAHHAVQGAFVVGGGEEPRLERTRREVDALVEHGVEERREPVGPLPARGCEVPHASHVVGLGEEDAE